MNIASLNALSATLPVVPGPTVSGGGLGADTIAVGVGACVTAAGLALLAPVTATGIVAASAVSTAAGFLAERGTQAVLTPLPPEIGHHHTHVPGGHHHADGVYHPFPHTHQQPGIL